MDETKKGASFNNAYEADRELLLWEKWVEIRREETTALAKSLQRPPVDLVMNQVETVREDKERKIVLEHAQISKKPGIRGNLWEQPQRLKQSCYCQPVYEMQRTPAEMGRPTVVEHIGVPHYILKSEKGMSGETKRVDCDKLDREYKKYRAKREHDLNDKIKKLDPFRVITSELIIKGTKPKLPPKKNPPLPAILVTPESVTTKSLLTNFYAIRINSTVLFKALPGQTLFSFERMQRSSWHESCTSWNYYFNTSVKRAGRAKIFLHNLGTVTLRYCWKKIKKSIPFIPEDIYEQVFFFNKNEDVLSPGQTRLICFTFVSEMPGSFSEEWELYFCNICFFDTLASKLVISLQGDAVEDIEATNRKVEILKTKIERKAVHNFIAQLLDNVLAKATSIESQPYSYKSMMLERDLFVMKNPVCFYHQTEVLKMKETYTEMLPGNIWDLSLTRWREAMMEKEYEERMKYYEILRRTHTELLKPWFEDEDLMSRKYHMVKLILGQMADKIDKEYDRLSKLYYLAPGPAPSPDCISRSKHQDRAIASISQITSQNIQNIFYVLVYDHISTTIETCAGILSSLDLNRWIHFDFCH